LPFGSGAGVLYNYGDLQFKNQTNKTFYLKTCLDSEFLLGTIFCINKEFELSYKIIEKDHLIYKKDKIWYRSNKIYRLTRQKHGGKVLYQELITKNNSPILYEMNPEKAGEINEFYNQKEKRMLAKLNYN
jgi:vancomycin resistance protein VanW